MKQGIKLALEPLNRFETNFLNRHDQALMLASAVGPECGVCLDAYHMNQEEADFGAALQAAGDDNSANWRIDRPFDPPEVWAAGVTRGHRKTSEKQLKFIKDHGGGILSEEFYSWLVESTAQTLLPLIR